LPFVVANGQSRNDIIGVMGDRPDVVGNPFTAGTVSGNSSCTAPTTIKNPSNWFNTCAFVGQTEGTQGDEGRNKYYDPHQRHLDLSMMKNFPIHEALSLQFRAEAFSITNTPNFGTPNASIGGGMFSSGTFGSITSTTTGSYPRQLQFGLRLLF